MFGIGGFELFIILVFIFVIFGPNKLPEVTKIVGMGIKKFRKAKAEMDQVLQEEIVDPVMKVANEPDPPKKEEKQKEKETTKTNSTSESKKSNTKTSNTNKTKSSTKKTNTKKSASQKSAAKKGGK